MKIQHITEAEFVALAVPILFHDPLFAQMYCVLMQDDAIPVCKFSARSTLVQPVIQPINQFIAIGIDETVGFWDLRSSIIAKQLSLSCPFYDFYLSTSHVFIVSELEVLILNAATLNPCGELSYNNFIRNIEVDEQHIKVFFLDGEVKVENMSKVILPI